MTDQVTASDAGIRIDHADTLNPGWIVRDPQGRWWTLAGRYDRATWNVRHAEGGEQLYRVRDAEMVGWRLIPSLSVDNPASEAVDSHPDPRAGTGDTPDPATESGNPAGWAARQAEWAGQARHYRKLETTPDGRYVVTAGDDNVIPDRADRMAEMYDPVTRATTVEPQVTYDTADTSWSDVAIAENVAYVHTYDIDTVAERRHADALAWALRGFRRDQIPDWVDGDDEADDFVSMIEAVAAALSAHPAPLGESDD